MEQGVTLGVAIVAIVIFLTFWALLLYGERCVDKLRAKSQKRLNAACQFAEEVNNRKRVVYVSSGYMVDEKGLPVAIFSELGEYEFVSEKLALQSPHPDRGIQMFIKSVDFKTDEYGRSFDNAAIQFVLCPAQNVCSEWTVLSVSDYQILCDHPVMGRMYLSRTEYPSLAEERVFRLRQFAEETPEGYVLRYELC